MKAAWWSGENSRKIKFRIVVEGELVLETPAHFSNGDTDELVDMPLLVDPFDGQTPLLSGASLAGALRSYLREREEGYGKANALSAPGSSVNLLFGGQRKKAFEESTGSNEEGEQSCLIIDDALGKNFGIEYRCGVAIDPVSRTAQAKKLFDYQLWEAGTVFPLRFELVIPAGADAERLKKALATALEGFNDGSITLGARKRRGFGRISVKGWRVKTFDLTTTKGLLDWIENGGKPLAEQGVEEFADIKEALKVKETIADQRCFFRLEAAFSLDGSLLVRSGGGEDDFGPDMVHIASRRAGRGVVPVLPGTSLGGALRGRALKIVNTLSGGLCGKEMINNLFGPEMEDKKQPQASRIVVSESVIEGGKTDLVQSRVAIDRFTGGALETALYNDQPVFGGEDTLLKVTLFLRDPKDYEIGLLLLLLKDLWTGDLPLGGEVGIGRGRLKGKAATLEFNRPEGESWSLRIEPEGDVLKVEPELSSKLESYVKYLSGELKKHLEEGRNEARD